MLKKLALSLSVLLTLMLAGCGSNAKKADDAALSAADAMPQSAFEVNSDSDSMTAGSLQTVHFAFNSSALSDDTRNALDANVGFLSENANVQIQVEGHCDERGSIQYNLALGERRAKAVRDYLIAKGIPAERITTVSFGKEKPLGFGHDEMAWGKNRRANFVITAL